MQEHGSAQSELSDKTMVLSLFLSGLKDEVNPPSAQRRRVITMKVIN